MIKFYFDVCKANTTGTSFSCLSSIYTYDFALRFGTALCSAFWHCVLAPLQAYYGLSKYVKPEISEYGTFSYANASTYTVKTHGKNAL
jgi:hypothetical protein